MAKLSAHPPFAAPRLRGYVEASLLVAVATLIGLAMAPRWGGSAIDLLYLPAVLAAAVSAGLGPSLFAALLSALAYNFFFTSPVLSFHVENPNDVVTVVVLFAVATVTSRLAASVRRQARIAQAHAARNVTIAGLAGRLLACTGEREIGDVSTAEIGRVFECNAALLARASQGELLGGAAQFSPGDIAVAALVFDTGQPAGRGVERAVPTEWQFHPVRSVTGVIAAMALARDDGAPPVRPDQRPLLENLLDQVALALERARLESDARDFARVRERDQVRSTLLSTIGQDLAPRLHAITDAIAHLRREGSGDKALVSLIGSEAARIDGYVSNLIELTPEADQRPLEIGDVTIDLFRRTVRRGGEDVHLPPKDYAVLAELAKHPGRVLTHAHLLRTVWGPAHEKQIDYLRVAIRALRQKLERDPAAPELIVNEPSVGYRLSTGA